MENQLKGIYLDMAGQYESAIQYYEDELKLDPSNLEIMINLMVLYWLSASQFAWADANGISPTVRNMSVSRVDQLMGLAERLYPMNAELKFWKKYFPHRLYGSDLSEKEVISILSVCQEKNLVPYFFLYLFDKEKYSSQREELMKVCSVLPTAKNKYILSVIESG